MRLDIAGKSHTGQRKKRNEDSFAVFDQNAEGRQLFDEGALLCVADGLGGHLGGEIASKLAVSHIKDALKQEPAGPLDGLAGPLPNLFDGIRKANAAIFQSNQSLGTGQKAMGTTLLAAVTAPGKIYVANVGDSRAYHIRDGVIIDKTEDHSWVDEQVRLGKMTEEEAEKHDRRNVVTRTVGVHPDVEPDHYEWPSAPGDWLLLCTDGLVNMVADGAIEAEFGKGGRASEVADRLVDLANKNGGKDNITVIAARLEPTAATAAKTRAASALRRHGRIMLWLLAVLLAAAAGLAAGFVLGRAS
jgi:protein phosphatase